MCAYLPTDFKDKDHENKEAQNSVDFHLINI